ncbi:ABC transporter ATP-binding protein [Propionicicella superfundia]|uniref:ABC transporter ATP-binding protein n=1 Tax=Propionicicella superfundia TaxID=348582 RepID=UPI00040FAC55|nr:ABC transporter ATP-binding protein [Propionicicella superfundia]
MITARGLVFTRRGRPVVDRVDLQVPTGRTLGVVGPNGSGKTTLLRLLYGSLTPIEGTVEIDGRPLARLGRREVSRRLAVVPQSEHAEIALSVADTVLLGRLPHRSWLSAPGADDYEVCAQALNRLGIGDLAERPMSQISGGEAQRALLARAFAQSADHLLLDEPTNHLDVRLQHEVLGTVREMGATVIVVLHDLNLAARYCDQVLLLDGGRTVACGPPPDVLTAHNLEPVYHVPVCVLPLPDGRVHLMLAEHRNVTSNLLAHEGSPR